MLVEVQRVSWFVAGALLLARVASAGSTPEQRKVGRQHYEAATTHFNLGEFDQAAEEFRQVYKAVPEPSVLYNIAQSFRLAKNAQQALFFYQSYLRSAPPQAPTRLEVERRIKDLQAQLSGNAPAAPPPDMSVPPDLATPPVTKTATPAAKAPPPPVNPNASERLKPVVELIKGKRAGFRACFDAWGKNHPGAGGKVNLIFYLNPDGGMEQSDAELTGFDAPDVSNCILDYAHTLVFPKSSGKFTRFTYPFDFKPAH
jgi:tetratricopeptide (TPR) repeat protein